MRFTLIATLFGAVLALAPLQASADSWRRYDNPRFAYAIDIPPGFSTCPKPKTVTAVYP